jgi:hypothetical protein
VIDPHGIFDPRLSHDRLLLGLKGSMAEFELSLFRQRSFEAIRAKARRGELRFRLPVGLRWNDANKIELDPDLRVREAIRLVFRKFTELGSARQVLKWFRRECVALPVAPLDQSGLIWKLPDTQAIHGILTNPLYAGAYAFGRTESRTIIVQGHARKSEGHRKPLERWSVLIQEHHEGYISWVEYEHNQATLAGNAPVTSGGKFARGGRCLLIGLLRCQRCGRKMSVVYQGNGKYRVSRYYCATARRNHGIDRCIAFGGLRPDQAVAAELLKATDTRAIDAAIALAVQTTDEHDQRRKAIALELDQARYEARLAERRYQSVDPDNRLVAGELERRWNACLSHVSTLEASQAKTVTAPASELRVNRAALLALADDLPAVWNAPSIDPRLKQRIARLAIQEIIADVDRKTNEIVLVIHWAGGRHTELRIAKNKSGHTSRWTDPDAVKVIRRMAGQWSDRDVALTLNRLGLRTGTLVAALRADDWSNGSRGLSSRVDR